MKCPTCSSKTRVISTEKGHTQEARFLPKSEIKELVDQWGPNSCFRKRLCLSGHSFVTVEFCLED